MTPIKVDLELGDYFLLQWLVQCACLMPGLPVEWADAFRRIRDEVDLEGQLVVLRLPSKEWSPEFAPLSLFAHKQVQDALAVVEKQRQDVAWVCYSSSAWICRACEDEHGPHPGMYRPQGDKWCGQCGIMKREVNQ